MKGKTSYTDIKMTGPLLLVYLPPELCQFIYKYCATNDLKNLSCCNSFFYASVKPVLWSSLHISSRHLHQDLSVESCQYWLQNLIHTREFICRDLSDITDNIDDEDKSFQTIVDACAQEAVEAVDLVSNYWWLADICTAFNNLKKLSITYRSGWSLQSQCAILIGGLQNLTELKMVGIKVRDDYLDLFQQLSCLKLKHLRFHISNSWAPEDLLKAFSKLKSLEKLDIGWCSGAGWVDMSFLQGLTCIKEVHAHSFAQGFPSFLLPNLEKLNLSGLLLRDPNSLQNISNVESLTCLDLSRVRRLPVDLSMMGRITALRELYLDRSPLNDEGMAHLQNLVNLVKLNISATSVTDAGVECLRDMKELRELSCWENNLTDEIVESSILPHLSHLEFIDFCFCYLSTKAQSRLIEGLKSLKTMHYTQDAHYADEEWIRLREIGSDKGVILIEIHTNEGVLENERRLSSF